MRSPLRSLPVPVLCLLAFPAVGHAAGPHTGSFTCWQTSRYVSQINGEVSYSTRRVTKLVLGHRRHYGLELMARTGKWSHKGNHIHFRGGELDRSSPFPVHVAGTWHPRGVRMPHSQHRAAHKYRVVLFDRRSDDSDAGAPHREFDHRMNVSFYYCG
jgi:hypothetical protein